MFTLSSIVIPLLGASLAQAIPSSLEARQWSKPSYCDVKSDWDKGRRAAGSIFWMTNELDGNYLLSAAVGWDGKLSFAGAQWTGGLGGHGNTTDPVAPDGLFSQDSLNVVGTTMIAVNAGSNTVTMFEIDESNPTMAKLVGAPVWSGGTFPLSATIDKVTGNVCVLNGGSLSNVACFTADKKMGLTLMPNSLRSFNHTATTPPSGPAMTPSQILFSEDGKRLFAAIKGAPDAPGFIAVWDVMEDGTLSETFEMNTPTGGGALPFSMTFIRGTDSNAILNTDPAIGFSIFQFDGAKAVMDQGVTIEGQGASCWSEYSSGTKNYYIADSGTNIVDEVSVDSSTLEAKVVAQHQAPANSTIIDMQILTIDGKDYLYALAPGTLAIEVLQLEAPGKTRSVQSFNVAKAAEKAGVTISQVMQGINGYSKKW